MGDGEGEDRGRETKKEKKKRILRSFDRISEEDFSPSPSPR
jgi:hypothetical protein